MRILGRMFGRGGDSRSSMGGLTVVDADRPLSPRVWAIGGGKGGVGKSLVATNLGVLLARRGKKVLMIDADLGAANLHTFFGLEGSKLSLSSFLKGDVDGLEPLVSSTGVHKLNIVTGARDSLDVADLDGESLERLKYSIEDLDYDYVLLDIGPGTSSNMLDLFLSSDEGVLVTTPEPTSVENTYRYLKCLFLRRIRNVVNSSEDTVLKETLKSIFSGGGARNIKTVADIMLQVRRADPERGRVLGELMGRTRVSVLVNQTLESRDADLGASMKRACMDYFGVDIGHLGELCYDTAVTESVRHRKPIAMHYVSSNAYASFERCLGVLMEGEENTKNGRDCG